MPDLFTKLRWNAFAVWHARKERGLPFRPLGRNRSHPIRRVRAMVKHAYENVPFYREVMDQRGLKPRDFQTAADLARLPVIDRDLYVQQTEKFQAPNFANADGLNLLSSGTSGTPKKVRQEARALFLAFVRGQRQRRVVSHFLGRPFGYRETRFARPGGVVSTVRGFYEDHSWTPRRLDLKRQTLSPGDLSVEETAAALNQFQPGSCRGLWLLRWRPLSRIP